MPKKVIHISDEEAVNSFASLLARVSEGAEVLIERAVKPVAVLSPANPRPGRLLSESVELAKAHAKELGCEPTLGPDFAADLEDVISSREPRNTSTWE